MRSSDFSLLTSQSLPPHTFYESDSLELITTPCSDGKYHSNHVCAIYACAFCLRHISMFVDCHASMCSLSVPCVLRSTPLRVRAVNSSDVLCTFRFLPYLSDRSLRKWRKVHLVLKVRKHVTMTPNHNGFWWPWNLPLERMQASSTNWTTPPPYRCLPTVQVACFFWWTSWWNRVLPTQQRMSLCVESLNFFDTVLPCSVQLRFTCIFFLCDSASCFLRTRLAVQQQRSQRKSSGQAKYLWL